MASEYDVVNLGQGFPDFPPPDFAVQAFQLALSSDFMLNQYTKAFVSLSASPRGPGTQASRRPWGRKGQACRSIRPTWVSGFWSRAQRIQCGCSSVFTECLLCSLG